MSEQSTAVATNGNATSLVDLTQFKDAAQVFIKSGYFDSALGKTSPEVMVARAQVKLAAGAEIGLPPFLALQGIHWIQPEGQAGRLMKGAAVCAFVLGRSKKYRYTTIERSEKQAVIEFEELRDGEWVKVFTSIFTREMAGALATKAVYKNYMPAMLWNRAMTNGANTIAADELNGPAGEPDEIVSGDWSETQMIPEDVEAAKSPPEIAAHEAEPVAATNESEPEKSKSKGKARAESKAKKGEEPVQADPETGEVIEESTGEPEFTPEASQAADLEAEPVTADQAQDIGWWIQAEKLPAAPILKAAGMAVPSAVSKANQAQYAVLKDARERYIKALAATNGWELDENLTLNEQQRAWIKSHEADAKEIALNA